VLCKEVRALTSMKILIEQDTAGISNALSP
jgi:hypothetical protein